ncbi:hypothetical protein CDD82_7618 [Ophiocordyceps australis]|uniref:Carboxypeptidase n=1 Tax=Ophiocordyceps australis TaxID=1399860 RepID=A0A2C5YPW8_9HYPO|nr:hypothetical protein CDD82_7618 [Ophiocordyceps australis]
MRLWTLANVAVCAGYQNVIAGVDPENDITHQPQDVVPTEDAAWEHVVKGADVQTLQASNMTNYKLRATAVDPSVLGIDTVKQYSGYLDDDATDKHLFYWFFESRNDAQNDPVVLWLNGGPGCSSLTGLFMELGPSKINQALEPVYNPYSWNNNASVIFLDQPVNVGFSHSSGNVDSTVAAGRDVYALLSLFFSEFPEYASQDFHIAGESYAGHYIPIFATEILAHEDRNINLKSVLIGNGLTDPLTQYRYYRPMGCGEGGYPAVLNETTCQTMDEALPRCETLIQACYDSEFSLPCVAATSFCNNALIGPYQKTGRNVYDVRKPCEGTSGLCYDELEYSTKWLNQPYVMKALGAEVKEYKSCNSSINMRFVTAGDWMKPIQRSVPALLNQLPVLIYAGDADFICNWLGNRAWTDALEWPGHQNFNEAVPEPLVGAKGPDEPFGKAKWADGLAFVQIFEAGHMAPYDQPEASLEVLNRWLDGEWQ